MSEMYEAGAAHFDQALQDVRAGRRPQARLAPQRACEMCDNTGVVHVHFSGHDDQCPACQAAPAVKTASIPVAIVGSELAPGAAS
jgi:hypothetical protein